VKRATAILGQRWYAFSGSRALKHREGLHTQVSDQQDFTSTDKWIPLPSL